MNDKPDTMVWTPKFDTKEEAEAYAKEHKLDMRCVEIFQGPFLGDETWVIGVFSEPIDE